MRGGPFQGAVQLLRHPLFLLFLLGSGLIQSTHAVYYIFGTLNWQRLGYGEDLIGVLWAIGVIAEITLFAFSGWVVHRFGPSLLMVAGAAAAVLRWTIMAFDPPLWVLFPLQVLHAFTYGAAHLGAMHFVANAAPTSLAATAQSLYATIAGGGIMMSGFMLLAGYLYADLRAVAYIGMAASGLAALGVCLVLARSWDGKVLVEEEEDADDDRGDPSARSFGC